MLFIPMLLCSAASGVVLIHMKLAHLIQHLCRKLCCHPMRATLLSQGCGYILFSGSNLLALLKMVEINKITIEEFPEVSKYVFCCFSDGLYAYKYIARLLHVF